MTVITQRPASTIDLADYAPSILRTKLRVRIEPSTSLSRPRLLSLLHESPPPPLTIVSAPAGYGKTVLAAQYAASLTPRAAWLSLDRSDNNMSSFIRHLVAAIELGSSVELPISRRRAESGEAVRGQALANALLHELAENDQPLTIIVDDYRHIDCVEVHDFVRQLVEHPAQGFHLVVITRSNPPLGLARLRGQGLAREIRAADLRASRGELKALAKMILPRPLGADELDALEDQTEGWMAGLCLALQAQRHRPDDGQPVRGAAPLDPAHVHDFLMSEVLSAQSAGVQQHLLAASLLDRFTAPLCDALLDEGDAGARPFVSGLEFVRSLVAADLFVVSLGEDGTWLRLHPMFRSLLRRQLQLRYGPEYEVEIHRRASRWFADNDLPDEAHDHAVASGDPAATLSVVARFGYRLLDAERFHSLRRWLDGLPREEIDQNPAALALEALMRADGLQQHGQSLQLIERAEAKLMGGDVNRDEYDHVRGSLDTGRAYWAFVCGDPEQALGLAERACDLLPASLPRTFALAHVIRIAALQSSGDLGGAAAATEGSARDSRFIGTEFRPWVWARPYIDWFELDVAAMADHAQVLLDDGQRLQLADTEAHGHYFLGLAEYQTNRIDQAELHFRAVVDAAFQVRPPVVVYASIGLGLCYLARGDAEGATGVARAAADHAWETSSEDLILASEAFMAEIALRSGHPRTAMKWAETRNPPMPVHSILYYDPVITWVKAMLADGSPRSFAAASRVMDDHIAFAERVHSNATLVELLVMRASARSAAGDDAQADADIARAVGLTEPGRAVRLVADHGPALRTLLTRVNGDAQLLGHVAEILRALTDSPVVPDESSDATPPAVTPELAGSMALTNRELQVLAMLAARWSNKEIAKELFISPATVKKHTVRLYDKFQVHSRRDVVDKAQALGYLS